ncbi:zinc ABC transporter substrate-binding protein [Corynebacterium callunae]|uniref:metal ABC transporter solute-binding protein, Zn/Mn family n=1 Tax=Corynebacterium callunae TaxID=1721 RepID=UPI003982C5AF
MAHMKRLLWTLPILPLFLVGCSAASSDSGSSSAADDTLNVVTSTQVWADVASAVSADAEVEAIISGGDADPHSFEPSAADMAKVAEADIIIVGGGGYDSWLYDSLEADDTRVIHALELSEHDHSAHAEGEESDHSGHDHGNESTGEVDNEHVWYSTEAVSEVALDFAAKVVELNADATVTPDAVTSRMDELHAEIEAIPAVKIAQTEPIADHIISHSQLIESTPAGYRATTLSEGEPTASDVAAFQELIRAGGIDILVYNPQSASPVATSLKELAEENNTAVVEISETPDEGENFLDNFTQAIADLTTAAQEV